MNTTAILIILSSFLSIASVFPYLIGVIKGDVKPRIVTWVTWSALTGIASVAAFTEKHYTTLILLVLTTILTSSVAIIGWKHGDKKIEKLDYVCLFGAIVGIIVWWLSNSPSLAVVFTLIVDLIGGIPTLVHCWKKPDEEQWTTFAISAVGSLCTLLAVGEWRITAFAFPLYLVVMGTTYTTIILTRRKFLNFKDATN